MTKKTLINKISTRLLGLEFKSDNVIKQKPIKNFVKKYCLIYSNNGHVFASCVKYTANKNSNVRKTKQNRLMLLSNCAVCGKKKSNFIKNKEFHNFDWFKMNKVIQNFSLTSDQLMAELHLK